MLRCNLCGAPIGSDEAVVRVVLPNEEFAYHAPECAEEMVKGWADSVERAPRCWVPEALPAIPGSSALSPLRAVRG